jgi:hypothetical protein
MTSFYPLARESWGWVLYALDYPDVPPEFDYGYGAAFAFGQKVGSDYQRADGSMGTFNRQLDIDLRDLKDGPSERIVAAIRSRGHVSIRSFGRLPIPQGVDAATIWSPAVPVVMRFVCEYRRKGDLVYDISKDDLVPAHLAPPPMVAMSLLLDVDLPDCLLRAPQLALVADGWIAPACQREYGHTGDHGWEGANGLKLTWPSRAPVNAPVTSGGWHA